jgi:hypothetical protein
VQECVDDRLHVEHVDGAVAIDVCPRHDRRIGLSPQEDVDTQLDVQDVDAAVLVDVFRI